MLAWCTAADPPAHTPLVGPLPAPVSLAVPPVLLHSQVIVSDSVGAAHMLTLVLSALAAGGVAASLPMLRVIVVYLPSNLMPGTKMGLQGDSLGLSWNASLEMARVGADQWNVDLAVDRAGLVEMKPIVDNKVSCQLCHGTFEFLAESGERRAGASCLRPGVVKPTHQPGCHRSMSDANYLKAVQLETLPRSARCGGRADQDRSADHSLRSRPEPAVVSRHLQSIRFRVLRAALQYTDRETTRIHDCRAALRLSEHPDRS